MKQATRLDNLSAYFLVSILALLVLVTPAKAQQSNSGAPQRALSTFKQVYQPPQGWEFSLSGNNALYTLLNLMGPIHGSTISGGLGFHYGWQNYELGLAVHGQQQHHKFSAVDDNGIVTQVTYRSMAVTGKFSYYPIGGFKLFATATGVLSSEQTAYYTPPDGTPSYHFYQTGVAPVASVGVGNTFCVGNYPIRTEFTLASLSGIGFQWGNYWVSGDDGWYTLPLIEVWLPLGLSHPIAKP